MRRLGFDGGLGSGRVSALNACKPRLSIIVLNYNGARWLDRCVDSLRGQTILGRFELLLADNRSTDGSDLQARRLMDDFPGGCFIDNGGNLGFCEGNNRPAATAVGEWLLFLNNDTWLEPDCLAKLLQGAEASGAEAAMPLVLDYADDTFQSLGIRGLDPFGWGSHFSSLPSAEGPVEILAPNGCALLIRAEVFRALGGFDPVFFMYADELDLGLRLWVSGGRAVGLPGARLHHRGAANVNPAGGGTLQEIRTSISTRFYSNRNSLLALLKSGGPGLSCLAALQVGLILAEGIVAGALSRSWTVFRRGYLAALADAWRLRDHWRAERRRIGSTRRRGEFEILRRFLTLRPQRWDELQRIRRMGMPKISPR
jgi:GT2 family glycosyltransferase